MATSRNKGRSPGRAKRSGPSRGGWGWLFFILILLALGCLLFRYTRWTSPRPGPITAPGTNRFPKAVPPGAPKNTPAVVPPSAKLTNLPPLYRATNTAQPERPLPATTRHAYNPNALTTPQPATNPPPPVVTTNNEVPAPTNAPVRLAETNLVTSPSFPRPPTNALEIQVALVRQGISPGSIDGRSGGQTAAALRAFQLQQGFTPTGWLDKNTRSVLQLDKPAVRTMILEAVDLGALQPIQKTWLGKAEQTEMAYATALEFAAEKNGASPTLVRTLNPGVDWNAPVAGTTITVPDAEYPPPRRAARANVSLSGHWLRVFDSTGYLLAHFPCSIARLAEKRPVGELHITVMIRNPNYTFDPAVFPESEEAQQIGRKLIIPPGPNNPVGVAWIGLDRPGYGIHGTPNPEEVGRTESHGCFRLANWNAEYFRRMAWTGMPITVEP